jgi:hypothetical protein
MSQIDDSSAVALVIKYKQNDSIVHAEHIPQFTLYFFAMKRNKKGKTPSLLEAWTK